jgi:hypothetical protein
MLNAQITRLAQLGLRLDVNKYNLVSWDITSFTLVAAPGMKELLPSI